MLASSPHIVDLRPQSNHSSHRKCSKHLSLRISVMVFFVMAIMIGLGGLTYGLNHLENKDSQLIKIMPNLTENLANFEWQAASNQIHSFDNKSLPELLDKTFAILVEKTPIGYHYKYVRLYYSLASLNRTIQLLQNIPVLTNSRKDSQSWGDIYPNLLKEVSSIGREVKGLNQTEVFQSWNNLGERLDKINQLFGGNQPINYLLILNDSHQSRPLGGVIGGVVAVTISHWQIDYWRAYNASNLDNQISSKIIPPKEIQPITTNWTLRQSNWFGDINLFVQSFMSLWQKSSASSLFEPNAIVLFNSQDLKPLDTALGNLNINGNTVSNLRDYLENNLKNYRLTSGPLSDDYLDFVNDNLLSHLTTVNGQEWLTVLQAFMEAPSNLATSKYYFFPWKQASLAKTFNSVLDNNSFWFTSSDVNTPLSNLTSQNIKTSIKLESKLGGDGYELNWTVSLTNTNAASFNDYVRFYIPNTAVINSVNGLDKYFVPDDPINYQVKKFTTDQVVGIWEKQKICPEGTNYCLVTEGDRKAIAGWLKIKSGQTKTLKFNLELPSQSQSFTLIPQTTMTNTFQLQNNSVLESSIAIQPYVNQSNPLNQTLLIKFAND